MAEDKTIRELINENRRLRESVEDQTRASKETSSKLKEVGGVIKDDLKGVADSVTAPMKSFASAIPGLTSIGKMVSILAKPKDKMSAAEVEKFREEKRAAREQTVLLAEIAGGIMDLKDSFLKGLQKGAGFGLGAIAALIAAPVITLVNFFKSLGTELKFLNKLTGGRLTKLFQPFVKFFDAVSDLVNKAGTGKILKGDTFKVFGRFTNFLNKIISGPVKLFNRIMKVLGKFPSIIAGATSSFAPIAKFAAGFGRLLGKIFLPITILMSAFDFISGFMDGYSQDGIIGGLREGIISVVDGLVGGLIRMVTGAVGWILELIGLDKFAGALTQNVSEAIQGVYEAFRGVIDIVKGIFTLDFGLITSGLASITDGIIEIVTAPFDILYGLIRDIFGFLGFDLPDFDLANFIKETINSVIGWFTTLFDDPLLALQNLWSSLVGDGGLVDILFKPIDAAINWVLGIFGWSSEGNEFSLTDIVKNAITSVFMWIGDLFTDPISALSSLWTTLLGGYDSLMGLLFYPIDATINWVRGLFGWSDPEGEEFSLWGLIKSSLNSVWEWLAGLFDFDLGSAIEGLLPSWTPGWVRRALGLGGGDEEDSTEPPPQMSDEQLQAYRDALTAAQDRVARAEAGENVYTGPDFVGKAVDENAIEQIEAILAQQTAARAAGGPVRGGKSYLVGELGPELFTPQGSGSITSNNRMIQGIARQTANMVAMADAERTSLDAAIRQVQNSPPIIVNNSPTTVSNNTAPTQYVPVSLSDGSASFIGRNDPYA